MTKNFPWISLLVVVGVSCGTGEEDSFKRQRLGEGGSCPVVNRPEDCDGRLVPVVDPQTGCLLGFSCEPCPQVAAPPADFCPGGTVEYTYTDGCHTGFRCVQPPTCPVVNRPEDCGGVLVPLREPVTNCLLGFRCVETDGDRR